MAEAETHEEPCAEWPGRIVWTDPDSTYILIENHPDAYCHEED